MAREACYLQLLESHGVTAVHILRPLVDGLSGAATDLVEVIAEGGGQEVLQVFKLGPIAAMRREAEGTRQAARLMPQAHRMDLFEAILPGTGTVGLLRFRLAGPSAVADGFEPLLRYLDRTPGVAQAADVIRRALAAGSQARSPLKRRFTSLSRLRTHFEGVRRGRFWSAIEEAADALVERGLITRHPQRPTRLTSTFPFKALHDPFQDTPRARAAWDRSMPNVIAAMTHGDLNPRNVLVSHEGPTPTPVLIDFHRFGRPAPLALDFCRLEVGLQVKGLRDVLERSAGDDEAEEQLSRFEKWINDHDALDRDEGGFTPRAEAPRELLRVARFVGVVRQAYRDEVKQQPELASVYFGCLMLCFFNYLRPTYDGVLTDRQRQFAFYCGARIFKRHFLFPGPV